jgi:hypothetical protein
MTFYTLQLKRRSGHCVATIPDLCISEEAASPELALANVLFKEGEVIEKLQVDGIPMPLPFDKPLSYPRIRETLYKAAGYFWKWAVVYFIFLFLSAIIAAIIFPSVISTGRNYILSPASKLHTQKLLKHLGIITISADLLNKHSFDSGPIKK